MRNPFRRRTPAAARLAKIASTWHAAPAARRPSGIVPNTRPMP